jgi:hypothetical protein
MLSSTSDKVRACYERAAEAKRRATEAITDSGRAEFLEAESRWLKLASSYELAERINAFLNSAALTEQSKSCGICQGLLKFKSAAPVPGTDNIENRIFVCTRCSHTYIFTDVIGEDR